MGESHQEFHLLERARSDATALGQLYERYYPDIYRYCVHRLALREQAEDATSAVFLQVARSIGRFGGTSEPQFRAWLYRIATNHANDLLRRRKRRRELMDAACREGRFARDDGPDDHDRLDWPVLHAAICRLSAADQSLVVLRYFEGLSPAEIAEVLGRRSGAVRTGLTRALQRLRDHLNAPVAAEAGR